MKYFPRIEFVILCFMLGFYGISYLTETPEQLILKANIYYGGVAVATLILGIRDFLTKSKD